MFLKSENIEIPFWEGITAKNPSIAISGGADSAILLYLLCQQDIDSIRPYFLHRTNKPNFLNPAKQVIDFIQNKFPTVLVHELHISDVTNREQDITATNFEMTSYMEKEYNCDIFLTGSTANPPSSVFGEENKSRVKERDSYREVLFKKEDVSGDRLFYRPFSNVNKKFIADLYKQYNLIETLFPLTLSCTETTNTTHCKSADCWWCKERNWAFGQYT